MQVGGGGDDLPARWRLVVRYTDALLADPASARALRDELAAEFSPAELAELTLTVTLAMGFSRAAIAWGPPPGMPVTEVPTPAP